MTDTTITALLERLETLAVSVHLHETNATQLRADIDAAIERGDRLAAVAKDGQERLSAALDRATKAEEALQAAAPQRRIDVVTARHLHDIATSELACSDFELADAETILAHLREPVDGGAS